MLQKRRSRKRGFERKTGAFYNQLFQRVTSC
nr:MAG TPA: hypothetical protein [Caudoviricetes sp.]DAO90528.1 MAG TPA: hypothetical protein [Caudoviricetes sp.]